MAYTTAGTGQTENYIVFTSISDLLFIIVLKIKNKFLIINLCFQSFRISLIIRKWCIPRRARHSVFNRGWNSQQRSYPGDQLARAHWEWMHHQIRCLYMPENLSFLQYWFVECEHNPGNMHIRSDAMWTATLIFFIFTAFPESFRSLFWHPSFLVLSRILSLRDDRPLFGSLIAKVEYAIYVRAKGIPSNSKFPTALIDSFSNPAIVTPKGDLIHFMFFEKWKCFL